MNASRPLEYSDNIKKEDTLKKILGLTIAAILVIGMVGVGTWAYFEDTETTTATLSAGTLNLQVNGGDGAVTTFSMSNLKPGATGSGNTTVNNVGSLDGSLSVGSSVATNTENSPDEFNDGSPGDLGEAVNIAVYMDVNSNDIYDAGTDIGLKSDGNTYSTSPLQFATVDSYASKTWTIGLLTASGQQKFHVDWQFTDSGVSQNKCQGDSVSIDFTFTLRQQ
jgi:spore coat-associated protein N